jgi:putative SOS response-associated peptidase YedK
MASLPSGQVAFFTLTDIKGFSTINARTGTVTKSAYRDPLKKKRRCLVPASGFYEWKKLDAKHKRPFVFDLANGGEGEPQRLYRCTLIAILFQAGLL